MKKTISVIIPVYNEENSITACLTTLFNQTQKAAEIIIVNDGSTDSTVFLVKEFPVKVLSQAHKGPGAARNLGAKQAIGEILVFVDADMTFDENFLKELVAPILSGKTKGVFNTSEYVSNFDNVWAKCWNFNQNLYTNLRLNPKSREESEDFRAITKSEFDRVGGFSLTGYMDSRTLVGKLDYRPMPVENAISYHANPSSLGEIYRQARWIGRRKMKLGPVGQIINLVRYSAPFSIIFGTLKAVRTAIPEFFVFKPVYDLGFFSGTLTSLLGGTSAR
ncbi:hypothetical protein A3D09_02335 [Candidatus Collierbacteria bacterium RIFCSPHIGHO2_02_FULL_49_10]|uniref:Glycosyltransferase 2-like domain-containing protein n=1 Tax=Candidatus Collierbacteria bacterium RIFCSPHIGHO2_02_FULL_49_10 TaxID=1817723 RepID=A0A1F5ERR9_9BACT|nr:MAG: hypothetical protein A3D09_02335 [Candidatus Collierbacteria bacterium RIFCSPHIGHO2_02_FULL_49_10]